MDVYLGCSLLALEDCFNEPDASDATDSRNGQSGFGDVLAVMVFRQFLCLLQPFCVNFMEDFGACGRNGFAALEIVEACEILFADSLGDPEAAAATVLLISFGFEPCAAMKVARPLWPKHGVN